MSIYDIMVVLGALLLVVASLFLFFAFFSNPFQYPYFEYTFDVSGKRNPDAQDLIDDWLNHGGMGAVLEHEQRISAWKAICQERIQKGPFSKRLQEKYEMSLGDNHAYQFILIRGQTRYTQYNYVRQAYKVNTEVGKFSCSYQGLMERYKKLEEIGFQCTLREYNSKNQRSLMTKELREKIMVRDNYTCQVCGKYMPDNVGLHIDHIIPVSKGGKSVESNLRVLCDKCNLRKGNHADKSALISMECRGCGAKLTLPTGVRQCTCDYCGNVFTLTPGVVSAREDTPPQSTLKSVSMRTAADMQKEKRQQQMMNAIAKGVIKGMSRKRW